MDYKTANSAELAVDQYFIQWVKYPNQESDAYWRGWLEKYPDKAEMLYEARQLVLLLSQDEEEAYTDDLEYSWQQLTEARRNDGGQQPDTGKIISLKLWQNKKLLSVAAACLLFILSGIVFFQLNSTRTIVYATNYGERLIIQLPDSSVIVLNANSIATIPAGWSNSGPRKVQLQGEAYFSVTHKVNNQKFLVTTAEGIQVEVLGTEFNVSDRGNESKVVLASGKIRLSIEQGTEIRQLDMSPGEMVSITTDTKITRRRVKPELYTSWKNDKIYFDDYTLGEVATMLEQNYGYTVIFQDTTLSNQKITAYLDVKGPDDILTTISETFEVDVTRQNNRIIISSL